MKDSTLHRLLYKPGRLHFLCCGIALLGTIPILWPSLSNAELHETLAAYAGVVILVAFLISLAAMLASFLYLALQLRNLRAIGQLLLWALHWVLCWFVFYFFAILANLPPLHEMEAAEPIQQTDTLFSPDEQLTGPASLLLTILPEQAMSENLSETPNLTLLESEHEDILSRFLAKSPRWAGEEVDATFYARPGHVVARPAGSGSTLGLVHVAFLTLVEGEQMPQGYVILQPGDPFPEQRENQTTGTPDIALELGHRHYMLLAWRGSDHGETARKAINATISAVDDQFAVLAKTPTIDSIALLTEGRRRSAGTTPELRVCEAPTQYGTYQAEVYVNPGQAGTLLLLIKDLGTGSSLRLFNCPAQYSENENELFRHDIPGSIPAWMREASMSDVGNAFPPLAPIFAIKRGQTHSYFGVAFEVWFNPCDSAEPRRLLLRRCYKVQAYEEAPKMPEPPNPQADDILPEDNGPEEPAEQPAPADSSSI